MVIVLDANVLIAAALNIDGPYSKLLLDKASFIEFIVPGFIFIEIRKNELRICNYKKERLIVFIKNLQLLRSQVSIINDDEISDGDFQTALNFTKDIDVNDTIYVSLAIAFNALLLTDDKKLLYAIRRKGFANAISIPEYKNILKGINND